MTLMQKTTERTACRVWRAIRPLVIPVRIWPDPEPAIIEAMARALGDMGDEQARLRRDIRPCILCGYDGPGYYQPETHACAGPTPED